MVEIYVNVVIKFIILWFFDILKKWLNFVNNEKKCRFYLMLNILKEVRLFE